MALSTAMEKRVEKIKKAPHPFAVRNHGASSRHQKRSRERDHLLTAAKTSGRLSILSIDISPARSL